MAELNQSEKKDPRHRAAKLKHMLKEVAAYAREEKISAKSPILSPSSIRNDGRGHHWAAEGTWRFLKKDRTHFEEKRFKRRVFAHLISPPLQQLLYGPAWLRSTVTETFEAFMSPYLSTRVQ
jgi:hypothetical protein